MATSKRATTRAPRAARTAATESPPPSPQHPTLIVGIGASAGGLDAFKAFFAGMQPDPAMAFVLVSHLSPDHASLLAELVGRHASLPITEAVDGIAVEGGHAYVIPPNATMTIRHGVLQLSHPAPPRAHRWPIDTFFSSLAEDQGENAVGIVLSGSGSDGARGVVAIRERGGFTLAQAGPAGDVALPGMPASAAATGLVDDVLPVGAMPARLLSHRDRLAHARRAMGPDGARQDVASRLREICGMLRAEIGHDFADYKEKTLVRRVQRRMQVVQTDDVDAYVEFLREHPAELQNLFRELLIGVTEFFRDPEAFEALQAQVIPDLLAERGPGDVLRAWVPACATGEEAYTIAILLAEAISQRRGGPSVQVFATDIDDRAVAAARAGRFRAPLPGVTGARLARWFTQDGDDYVVAKPLREMIVFSPHSVIKDPPFSRMDLVSCRNLLIYLNPELQEQLLRTYHYALRPGGFLMLGPSESLGRNASLFEVLDKKHRLFRKRNAVATSIPLGPVRRAARDDAAAASASHAVAAAPSEDAVDRLVRRAMERLSPPYVVVDRHHDVLRFHGDTGRFLGPTPGAATLNLFSLLHRGLRTAARTVVQQATARNAAATIDATLSGPAGERIAIRLQAEPLAEPTGEPVLSNAIAQAPAVATPAAPAPSSAPALLLVAFKELGATPAADAEASPGRGRDSRRVQQLEKELGTAREQLHTAIDELETANEEMKSANEEYQSVNEELQSSNEELETSKEELQSINEELQTVNIELGNKNDALARLNSDLHNLLESTQIATLFLDSSLHVRGFTPAIGDVFHLREGDHGRPITEITPRVPYPQLQQDVRQVLRTLAMVERTLDGAADGSVYLLRMRPYRTIENVIDGVVLTFIDITERQQHEYERGRLAAIVQSSQDAIIGHTAEGQILTWNAGAERIFGYPPARILGKSIALLLPGGDASPDLRRLLDGCGRHASHDDLEMAMLRHDGSEVPVSLRCSQVLDPAGAVIGGSTIARDIGDRRRAARRLEESETRLAAIIEQTTIGVAQTDLSGRLELVNPRLCQILGRDAGALQGESLADILDPGGDAGLRDAFRTLSAGGAEMDGELRVHRPDQSPGWASFHASLIRDDDGKPNRIVVALLDVTRDRLAAEHRELLLAELNHRVKNSLSTVQAIAMQTATRARDLSAFQRDFFGRLQALADSHDLLSRQNWRGVGLRDIAERQIAPYAGPGSNRARVDGDNLPLPPRMALALGLGLHELATNAAKHGALSSADGQVHVHWSVRQRDGRAWLDIDWIESGGPAVVPPDGRGFGTQLLQDGLAHELESKATLDFAADGLRCTLRVPLPDGPLA